MSSSVHLTFIEREVVEVAKLTLCAPGISRKTEEEKLGQAEAASISELEERNTARRFLTVF